MLNSTFSAVVSPTFSTIAVNLTICLSLTSAPSGIFDVNVTFNLGPSPVDIPIIGESFVSADVFCHNIFVRTAFERGDKAF